MVATKYKATWKTVLFPVLGLVVFFVYVYVFRVDIQQIIEIVQGINPYLYLLAAIAVILETLFSTFAWHLLLRFLSVKISITKSFLFTWIGIFMDILIPAESISGEISKVYLVAKEQDGAAGKATASVLVHRLISLAINAVVLVAGATLVLAEGQLLGIMLNLIFFLIILTFVFVSLLLLLCIKEERTLQLLDAIIRLAERITRGRWKLSKVRKEAVEAAKTFHSAMVEFSRAPKTLLLSSSLSVVSWILALAVFYLSFLSIGYTDIGWGAILVIYSIFNALKSIPIGIPFEVGLPEITLTTLFILVGVPPQQSATVTILVRILTLWLRFLVGFLAQQMLGISAVTTPNTDRQSISGKE